MAANPQFVNNVKDAVAVIQNADGTSFKTLLAGAGSGHRIKSLSFTSDDTSTRVVQIAKTVSAVDYILGEISVTLGAGTDGSTAAINGLNATPMPALQNDGVSRFWDLASGTTLKIKSKVAVTAGKSIYVVAEYGDF